MKIGEFSRQSGVSVRMLRFYETARLLVPRRTAQGWRDYDAADVAFIRKAALLNRAGVPLKDLALMRDCLRDEPQDFCADLRGRLAATQTKLAGEIERLQHSERRSGNWRAGGGEGSLKGGNRFSGCLCPICHLATSLHRSIVYRVFRLPLRCLKAA